MKFNNSLVTTINKCADVKVSEYADAPWVLTPNRLLNELGFNPVEMEELRMSIARKSQSALKILERLEKYRGWWESEMEKLLLLQYKHPWLKDYKGKFDFNQIKYLLERSRNQGILNHYLDVKTTVGVISKGNIQQSEIQIVNSSGVKDELI